MDQASKLMWKYVTFHESQRAEGENSLGFPGTASLRVTRYSPYNFRGLLGKVI